MVHQSAPQQLSVAARNAEALFEAKTVGEIRQVGQHLYPPPTNPLLLRARAPDHPCPVQIEARTRQDIEDKNLQLRQLVGDSYRWVAVGAL